MVVDTMVVAYALLGEAQHREESLALLGRAPELLAPDSQRAELANVVWQWIRSRKLALERGQEVLRDAQALTQFVSSELLWERALALSVQRNHPVYDTLFVALAEEAGTVVASYDQALA